jgi:hypothetical protein
MHFHGLTPFAWFGTAAARRAEQRVDGKPDPFTDYVFWDGNDELVRDGKRRSRRGQGAPAGRLAGDRARQSETLMLSYET